MVFAGLFKEEGSVVQSMAMERSKPLHNFTLPFLKWGNQRYLRCMKLDSDRQSPESRPVFFKDSSKRPIASKSKIERSNQDDQGIEAVRQKLMIDLKTAADKMKVAFWRDEIVEPEEHDGKDLPAESRPWSLRTRRTTCKAQIDRLSDGGARSPEKNERTKFSVALSKKEIEEDFEAMVGRRPPRRPKKRPRIVQKQMDTLFPGLWLTEITADLYDVPEIPENAKR